MLLADKKSKINPKKIPQYLIYEELNGNILPYKGFREVLNGVIDFDGIRGNSSIKSFICSSIAGFVHKNTLKPNQYFFTIGASVELEKHTILTNNIAIYERTNVKLDEKYFNRAPKIAIEVDIKIDLSLTEWTNEWDYVIAKSNKMLDFGTEKIVWVTTKSKKIFVASKTERWYLVDFTDDIPIIDGCVLNLAQLLIDEDIQIQ